MKSNRNVSIRAWFALVATALERQDLLHCGHCPKAIRRISVGVESGPSGKPSLLRLLTLNRLWQPSEIVFSLWRSPLHYFRLIIFDP